MGKTRIEVPRRKERRKEGKEGEMLSLLSVKILLSLLL
jgi:hypothetical protein